MKKTVKLAVIGGIMALGLVQTHAQNINIVQNLNVNLKGFAQGEGAAAPVRITNKDILTVLGTQAGADFTGGKLHLVTSGEGGTSVIVRKRGLEDTNVSGSFTKTQISDGVTTDRSTEAGTDLQTYSINRYTFGSEGTDFDVQGFTTERTRSVFRDGELVNDATDTKSTVAGTGTVADAFAVLQGNVNVTGRKVEVTE
jgi:hypothetical protein